MWFIQILINLLLSEVHPFGLASLSRRERILNLNL